MRRVHMSKWVAISLILLIGLTGCMVSKTQYEATVADMEAAKADLEKSRMHQEALEEQIRNLKSVNEKISTDLEMATTEVQRIKEGRKNEQALLETREQEMEREKAQLTAKLRVLTEQYQKVKAQNRALKDTVVRYQKELKDTRESGPAGISGMPKSVDPTTAVKKEAVPSDSAGSPATQKPGTPKIASAPTSTGQALNINKATVSDMVLTLGLSRDVAEEVVANRPYRLRGELVAKNIIPKSKFDEIKDRITAAP